MGVDPEQQVEILQTRIHERLAELRAITQAVRVGAGHRESGDPEDSGPSGEERAQDVREIDLTDGIDLTDARLAESRWDDEDDPERLGEQDEDEIADDDVPRDFTDGSGDLLEDSSRRRQHRHRADAGPAGATDVGPRLLPDRPGPAGGVARPSLQDATDAVIAATRELISYERRLPLLLDAAPRRQSLLIVRWSGVLTAAVAVSLLVVSLARWLAFWWVLPAVACAGAAYLLLRVPVHPPGDRHETLRPGSVIVAAGALLTAICAASDMPTLVLLLGLVAMAGGIWHTQQTPMRIAALPRRFR